MFFRKLWLIVKREYLTRVRKKTFILSTLLTPIGIGVFFVVVGFIFSYESDDSKTIAILDEGNVLNRSISDTKNLYFQFPNQNLEELKEAAREGTIDGVLVIPAINDLYNRSITIYYYSNKVPTPDVQSFIENRIEKSLREHKISALNLDKSQIEALNTSVSIDPEPLGEDEEDATRFSTAIGAGVGSIMGIVMYMVVFIYGMMVMRSVMEEKTTRIVEVMISTVKPFQLMLGKIIGVGGVGLTQILIWIILIPLISLLVNLLFGFDTTQMDSISQAEAEMNPEDLEAMISLAVEELKAQNWWVILPIFILFFLGGFLLYSSMFAAIGSAIGDDMGEGQSLTLPVTIPVVIAFYIMFVAVQAPHSSLAVWASIFPLFSPIVMPARLAFDPPTWQILLSIGVLIATVIFVIWLAGRIYRVGILMYGKKGSFKEIARWMFSKA